MLYWIDLAIQLAVVALGDLVGAGAAWLLLKLAGAGLLLTRPALYLLTLPLAVTLLSEAFTGLWRHTPGSLGLGGLTVFLPMLLAGAAAVALALLAQNFLPSGPPLSRRGPPLTAYLALALAATLLALCLWRFWPEPRARLW
ncbi:MAG: hypothetical protein WD100_13950 [Tistlia sp.]|uniref:hypothetical protein n=1 Tax=Tistlia sp. TaxID=3057121 RepID=UPI0034A2E8FF